MEASFGERYSHFTDESGSRFRALTGRCRPAGPGTSSTGREDLSRLYDGAGKQSKISGNETAPCSDEASGWASGPGDR